MLAYVILAGDWVAICSVAGCLALGYAMLMSDAFLTVNSLPPIALDSSKAGDEPECRDAQEAKPDPNPQQALLNALTWLSSDDW